MSSEVEEVIALEPHIFTGELRRHMPAQFIEGALHGQAKREAFRLDRLLPLDHRANLPVREYKDFHRHLATPNGLTTSNHRKRIVR